MRFGVCVQPRRAASMAFPGRGNRSVGSADTFGPFVHVGTAGWGEFDCLMHFQSQESSLNLQSRPDLRGCKFARLPGVRPRMERNRGHRSHGARAGRPRLRWERVARWRYGHGDQRPQSKRLISSLEDGHEGQEHSSGRGRSRHRLQDRRHWRDVVEVGVREEGVDVKFRMLPQGTSTS